MIQLQYRNIFSSRDSRVANTSFFLTVKWFHILSPGQGTAWAKKTSVWVQRPRHKLLLAVFTRIWHLYLSDSLPAVVAFAILTFVCERYSGSFAGMLYLRQFYNAPKCIKENYWHNKSSKLCCQRWPTGDSYMGGLCIFTCLSLTSAHICFFAPKRKECGLWCLVTGSLFWNIPRNKWSQEKDWLVWRGIV